MEGQAHPYPKPWGPSAPSFWGAKVLQGRPCPGPLQIFL